MQWGIISIELKIDTKMINLHAEYRVLRLKPL